MRMRTATRSIPPDLDQHRTRNRMATFLHVSRVGRNVVLRQEVPVQTRTNVNNSEGGKLGVYWSIAWEGGCPSVGRFWSLHTCIPLRPLGGSYWILCWIFCLLFFSFLLPVFLFFFFTCFLLLFTDKTDPSLTLYNLHSSLWMNPTNQFNHLYSW